MAILLAVIMEWWKTVIEIKPIDLALVLSAVGVVVWFFVNRFYRKRDTNRQIRLETYRGFLNKMDEAHHKSRIDFGKILEISQETFAEIIRNPDNSDETLVKMNQQLSRLTADSLQGWQIYSNEINLLSLVCSKEMLSRVEEYKELNKKVSDTFTQVLTTINFLDPKAEEQIQSLMSKAEQERMVFLYNEIKKLMRKEIGID